MYQRFISFFFYLKINSRFQKEESVTYENENSGRSKVGNISDINFFARRFVCLRLRTLKWQHDGPIHVIQYKHAQERNSSMVIWKTDIKRGIN